MFKKLFGISDTNSPTRSLEHASDLQKGDAVRIGFDEIPEISNGEFFVEKVTGLDLSANTGFERRILHLGVTVSGHALIMWVDNETGHERLAFAYSADQLHVEAMIDLGQFTNLFTPERDYLVEVDANQPAISENPWLAPRYTEDQAKEVYWLDGDPKMASTNTTISNDEAACDYFRLISKDQNAAVEAFVFNGGRTEVYFVKYLPLYKIEEYMPAG